MADKKTNRLEEVLRLREENKSKYSSGYRTGRDIARERLTKIIGMDTFETDLENMGNTINDIQSNWQTPETMANTKAAVEAMHGRIGGYQTYQKLFGGKDLTDLQNRYQSILEGWDDIAQSYTKFDSNESYQKALADARAYQERYEQMRTSDLDAAKKELDALQAHSDKVDEYENTLQGLNNRKSTYNSRTRGLAGDGNFDEEIKSKQIEYSEYLKSTGYSNTEDLRKALNEKTLFYNQAKHIQNKESLEEIRKDENFQSYVESGLALADEKEGLFNSESKNKIAYNRLHPEQLELAEQLAKGESKFSFGSEEYILESDLDYKAAKYMTNEQFETYNAYLGREGEEKAEEYLKAIEEDLNVAMANDIAGNKTNLLDKYTFAAESGVDQFWENTFNLFSKDDYIVPSATQMASGLVREGLDGSGFEVFGSSIGQVAYDAINTTANMAPSILTSMVVSTLATPVAGAAVGSTIGSATGSLAMGASAAGSGYQEMLNLGYNKDQARTYSTLVGASEGMMQYLLGGIGALGGTLTNNVAKSIVSGIDNAFFKFSVNLALNGVGEGIEEGLQDIIAPSFENIIAGYQKNKLEDIDWEQVAYDTMLGALTSWAIEGSSDAVSYIGQHSYNASTGKNLKANDKLSGFADLFDTMEMQGLTPEQSEAYKLYGEYLQKGDIDSLSNAKIGKLYNTAMSESVETMGSKDSTESQVKDAASRYVILDEMSKPRAIEKKVQERVETLSKGEVTEVTSTGNSTTIEGIKIEDGSTIVLTSEGEHKAEDMTFSSNDAELVAYAEVMGAEKGNLLIKNYDGSQNINSYVNSFNMAYTYGEDGIGVDNAIKNKGVLTEKQVSEIYTTAIKQKSEARQKAIDEVVKKYSAKTIKKGVFDDSIIDYNSKNADGTKVNWNTLTTKQREAIRFAKAFSKVTGVNIVFEKSKIVNGQHKGKNGSYNPNNNTITLDVYAGRMDASTAVDAIIPTLSHEVTHWMKAKAPEMYSKLQEKVMNTLALDDGINMDQRITAEMVRMKKEHPNSNVTPESAIDEIVARSCEDMLSNSETARELLSSLSEKEQKTFMEKVEEVFNNLIEWVNNLLGQYKSESDEAKFLSEYKEQLQEAQKMWDQAFAEAVKTNQALQKKGKTAEAAIRESLEKNGVITNGDNATVYSVRYLLDEKTKDKVASDLVKALGVTKAEADNYLAAETSIASIVLNPKHQEFLDYEADDGEVAIKKNSDYPQGTVDFSNICAKRRDFTSVMNRVMSKFKDHIFLSTDLAKIRTIMSDEKITIPCGICYVEDRRQLDSIVAEDFIKALELYRNGSNTRPDGKPFNANQLKALKMVDNNTYTPSIYELITLEGRNALKDKDPDMESAWINYNNARGMQSVRLLTNEAEYKREILKYSPAEVKRKNDLGGLRIYSFSDAEIPHLIDLVQVITDSASKGLAIQGYTKVNWYANMIKNTGVKINRSLIPLGSLGYRIENGKVVLEYDTVEGIDINDKNFFDNTEYDNVGNILIGINEVQIKAAMLDKFVDYIIPFHTGQSADVLKEKGIHEWQNYKNSQSERKLSDGKKSDKQINIYTDVIQRAETEGNPITNKVEFVEKFLAVCKENGLIPRFSEFLNTDENGDYVYTEGYHKLIIDFKMFNPTTGEYLPQKPVVPNFDNGFITKTLNEFVEQEKTKQIQLQPKMDKAIERIEKEVIGMQHEQFADRLREKITPTYEELVKKKPVRIVDVRNGIKSDTYANMKKAVMEKAQREKWFDVPHRNDDTESFIFLTKDSFNHAYSNLTAAFGEDTIRCMAHIPEIIKEAILTYVDEPKNARKMEKKVYTFFGAVNGIKSVEPVKLTVKAFDVSSLNTIPQNIREYFERAGIDDEYISLYDVKALEVVGIESIKKETDASAKVGENSRARGTSDSYRISVSELFKLVNGDATKYLPKELQFSDREIDSWLDDLSVDDLLELLRSEIDEQKKEKTTRRVDEVNKMLKQIGLEFNGTKQAAWTDERIENYLSCSYYGSSNPNYAQAYITYMTPKQFLDLTMGGETTTVERIKKESDSYGAVDFEKLGESSPIFLEINEGKNWSRVIGHEGRHRMYLLGKAGFEKIPVLVFDYSTKYDKAAKDEMKLIAQRFNDTDLISRARNTSVHDVIPFSQGNKELIKQKFGPGKDADIYYSDRDSDYIGPRTLLTNALETVAQTTEEKELLTEYRKDIDILGIKESELAAIKSEIKELSFAKGKRDTQRLDYLQKRAEKLQSSINWYDKKLLNMEAAAPLKAVVDRERAKAKKKAYEKSREYARERMTSYKEGVEKKAKIDSITQKTTMLAKWMKTPTKDKHIPDDLKGPVKDLLAAIDFASKNVGLDTSGQSEALAKLSGSVQDAKKNLGLRANLIALQMATVQSEEMKRAGVDFSSDIEKLSNSIGDMELKSGELFVLKDMSLEDLVALDKVVTTLRTVIKKTNEYYTLRRKITNTAAAHELFDLFDSLGTASVGKLDGVANFFNYDNITPINFFDRLGDVGKDLFHAFAKSQDRMAFLAKKTKEFAEGTWTARDVKKWDSDLIEFEVVDAKKTVDPDKPVMKKVYTTTSRLMTLYLHDKREQSRYHLYDGGGGRFTTFEHGLKTYGEDVNGVALSKELVQQMLQKLDPKAKEVADAISEFFNIFCKDLGNEVTLDMYGTELFVEDNYVPIEVIEESVSRQMEKPARSITALLNKGFTKEVKPNAHNQIVLDSIFNVFSKHASEMISYNAFARTVYDAVRLFEYKETRKSYALNKEHGQPVEDNLQTKMKGALGDGAVKYFRNFLEDVNGTQIAGRGDNMLGKAFSNAKLANVAWSLNVALLQPLSLIRATTMVNPIYLAKGTFKIRHGIEKAMEKSGVALWKSFGYRDTDISKSLAEQIKNNKTFGDKMKEWSMKAPEIMDEISWGALWSACEYQVLADNKGIEKGSQKFYDEVSDLFEEVVYRTQVMDSVLSRSQIMRNKSGMVKGLTSYMAEPLVTYNMVYGIFSQWNLDSRKGDNFDSCFKRHGKKLTVAIGAYGLSALAEAGIRTLTTAMKNAGDDDDDEVFKEQLIDNLNPLNKIPIARELVSALQGYGVSSIPGLDTVEAFVNAYKAISKMIFEGDKVSYKKVQKILKAISYGSGQGMSNATKEVVAIWNLTIGQAYPSLFIDISK